MADLSQGMKRMSWQSLRMLVVVSVDWSERKMTASRKRTRMLRNVDVGAQVIRRLARVV
jgi:hypothetical protein